ncbi:MAG: hypothetical protein AAGD14_02005 [Planctomycetota bacterium]
MSPNQYPAHVDFRDCEAALVGAFIVPTKRGRYRSLLANPKRRKTILDGLNHLTDLDPRYATSVPSTTDIAGRLRQLGAPDRCHLVSNASELDGREMNLEEAIEAAEFAYQGTLVGCIPGELAYYYGEGGEKRVILHRSGRVS